MNHREGTTASGLPNRNLTRDSPFPMALPGDSAAGGGAGDYAQMLAKTGYTGVWHKHHLLGKSRGGYSYILRRRIPIRCREARPAGRHTLLRLRLYRLQPSSFFSGFKGPTAPLKRSLWFLKASGFQKRGFQPFNGFVVFRQPGGRHGSFFSHLGLPLYI